MKSGVGLAYHEYDCMALGGKIWFTIGKGNTFGTGAQVTGKFLWLTHKSYFISWYSGCA